MKDSGRELVGEAGWGWGEWSTDAVTMFWSAHASLRLWGTVRHTGNRALAEEPDGRGALSVHGSLAKDLGGKHCGELWLWLCLWLVVCGGTGLRRA